MKELTKQNKVDEENIIEFVYVLWRNKLLESKFILGDKSVDFRDEAISFYLNDPTFRTIYDSLKDLFKSFYLASFKAKDIK